MANDNSATKPTIAESKKTPAAPAVDTLKDWALLHHLLRAKERKVWGPPASGEYSGGCATGRAAGKAYLKILSESPNVRTAGGSLQHIAIDMLCGQSTDLGTTTGESLRGQAVGFFLELDMALAMLMKQCRVSQSFEELTAEMDKGLARTKADDEADLKAARSRDAQERARRRKARQSDREATAA
jgi:hypothetical protein